MDGRLSGRKRIGVDFSGFGSAESGQCTRSSLSALCSSVCGHSRTHYDGAGGNYQADAEQGNHFSPIPDVIYHNPPQDVITLSYERPLIHTLSAELRKDLIVENRHN